MTREIPFECSDYSVDGLALSFLDSEGTKPPLHFSHANGFPVSMYLPWMTELALDFRVMGLSLRGQDGLGEGISSWHRVALDLAGFLETREVGPVVGVGHSIGAVTTMLCAARRPDLFSRIVLLDPPLFPRRWVTPVPLGKALRPEETLSTGSPCPPSPQRVAGQAGGPGLLPREGHVRRLEGGISPGLRDLRAEARPGPRHGP